MRNVYSTTMTRRLTAVFGAGLVGTALLVGSAAQAAQDQAQDVEKRVMQLEQRVEQLTISLQNSRTAGGNVAATRGAEKSDTRNWVEAYHNRMALYGN